MIAGIQSWNVSSLDSPRSSSKRQWFAQLGAKEERSASTRGKFRNWCFKNVKLPHSCEKIVHPAMRQSGKRHPSLTVLTFWVRQKTFENSDSCSLSEITSLRWFYTRLPVSQQIHRVPPGTYCLLILVHPLRTRISMEPSSSYVFAVHRGFVSKWFDMIKDLHGDMFLSISHVLWIFLSNLPMDIYAIY